MVAVEIRKGYADTSIGQLHYRRAGEGDFVILLHQTPTCSEVYEPLMHYLAPHVAVVAPDTPGFGMSSAPARQFTIPEYVGVIKELLDALNISATHVFGHHTGATLACEMAASLPRRVKRLIMSSPVCLDEEERKRRIDQLPNLGITEDGSYLKKMWDDMVGRARGEDLPLKIKHREITWRLKAGPQLFEMVKTVYNYDMANRLPLLQTPTLVLAGEFDRMRHAAEHAVRLIPEVEHKIVPGGHPNWLEIQQPEELARFILEFIRRG